MSDIHPGHPDYPFFFGDEGVWRNPNKRCEDESTISTVDFYHVDQHPDEDSDDYFLEVCHCRSFPNGKGFMGRYRSRWGGCAGNGRFIKGTDETAYNKAMEIAREAMWLCQREFNFTKMKYEAGDRRMKNRDRIGSGQPIFFEIEQFFEKPIEGTVHNGDFEVKLTADWNETYKDYAVRRDSGGFQLLIPDDEIDEWGINENSMQNLRHKPCLINGKEYRIQSGYTASGVFVMIVRPEHLLDFTLDEVIKSYNGASEKRAKRKFLKRAQELHRICGRYHMLRLEGQDELQPPEMAFHG